MNDSDFISSPSIYDNNIDCYPDQKFGDVEISICNQDIITKCAKYVKEFLPINNCTVELGVDRDRSNPNTSSKILLRNLIDHNFILFVDIADRYHIVKNENQTFIQMDSGNIDAGFKFLEEKNIKNINLLFIDTWHSVNQVLKEWAWTKILDDNGIVVFHDSNKHPGPKEVLSKLDTKKWTIKKLCTQENDNGIAVVWKINNLNADYLNSIFS